MALPPTLNQNLDARAAVDRRLEYPCEYPLEYPVSTPFSPPFRTREYPVSTLSVPSQYPVSTPFSPLFSTRSVPVSTPFSTPFSTREYYHACSCSTHVLQSTALLGACPPMGQRLQWAQDPRAERVCACVPREYPVSTP